MDVEQASLLIILAGALLFFIIGKPRYDLVSFVALILACLMGIVPFENAFTGFAHPAVITVIAILIISAAVEETGILENLAYQLKLSERVVWKQVGILCFLVCLISSLINNVGAVAMLIHVSLKVARIQNIPRSLILMPLAFSSLLGGLITLIGTPPNLIISQYRYFYRLENFQFFDFTPVGIAVALTGVLFVSLLGSKLIPIRRKKDAIPHENFTVELKIPSSSPLVDQKGAVISHYQEDRVYLGAIIRDEEFHTENLQYFTLKKDDILILETDKLTLRDLIKEYKLKVISKHDIQEETSYSLSEITLLPNNGMVNRKVSEINEGDVYPLVILAVSRSGVKLMEDVREITLLPGDVLLIKSSEKMTRDKARKLNALLIEETWIPAVERKQVAKVLSFFSCAILAVIAGVLKADLAFMSAAILMILTNCISLEKAYASIQWPIVVLLGTLIPVGEAIETTGLAKMISVGIYEMTAFLPLWVSLFFLILASMLLSNVMNNAAVAVVFAPIAATFASFWNASIDPFLMGVAVGSSCTFLTPIGHQSNALIYGPGRYRFADFWKLGAPLSIIVSVVATAMITFVWPFFPPAS